MGLSKRIRLPAFRRTIKEETASIGGVPVKFWRRKGKWFWGVADAYKAAVKLPERKP